MKRLIVFSVIFVIIAGAAFAQLAEGITLYAWGSGAFVPIRIISDFQLNGETQKNTGYSVAGAGISWGGMRPGLVVQIDGTYQYAGFTLAFNGEGDFLASHEVGAHFWVKPFGNDLLKLTLGKFVEDTLRGRIGSLNGGFEYFTL